MFVVVVCVLIILSSVLTLFQCVVPREYWGHCDCDG